MASSLVSEAYVNEVLNCLRDVSTLETTQDGRPAGVLYYFSAQDARERANALSKALENIGIVGASLKPKYVAAHVPTNPSYIGVILTSKNEQDIRDLVCSRLGLKLNDKLQPLQAASKAVSAAECELVAGTFQIIPFEKDYSKRQNLCSWSAKQISRNKETTFKQLVSLRSAENSIFRGFVVIQERSCWVLHICPGGKENSLSQEEIEKAMPNVIKMLNDLKIRPEKYCVDGCESGKTQKNFEAWMHAQSKL